MKYEYRLLLFFAPSLSISERTNIECQIGEILILAKDGHPVLVRMTYLSWLSAEPAAVPVPASIL